MTNNIDFSSPDFKPDRTDAPTPMNSGTPPEPLQEIQMDSSTMVIEERKCSDCIHKFVCIGLNVVKQGFNQANAAVGGRLFKDTITNRLNSIAEDCLLYIYHEFEEENDE